MLDYSLYMIIDIDVPLSSHFYQHLQRAHLMLLERFSREEFATVQLPCASDINI